MAEAAGAGAQELEEKGKELDARKSAAEQGLDSVVGVRLDVLKKIVEDLDAQPRLREIFGEPVSAHLGLMALGNDLKFSELEVVELDEAKKKEFVDILREILGRNLTEGA